MDAPAKAVTAQLPKRITGKYCPHYRTWFVRKTRPYSAQERQRPKPSPGEKVDAAGGRMRKGERLQACRQLRQKRRALRFECTACSFVDCRHSSSDPALPGHLELRNHLPPASDNIQWRCALAPGGRHWELPLQCDDGGVCWVRLICILHKNIAPLGRGTEG